MKNSDHKSRRNFLKKATAATSAAIITSKTRLEAKPIDITPKPEPIKQVSPNDRIRIALIGAGGQGTGDTGAALRVPGVESPASLVILLIQKKTGGTNSPKGTRYILA